MTRTLKTGDSDVYDEKSYLSEIGSKLFNLKILAVLVLVQLKYDMNCGHKDVVHLLNLRTRNNKTR